MVAEEKSTDIVDAIYGRSIKYTKNHRRVQPDYTQDELDEPKHRIGDPAAFARGRQVLGNIISKRMKTSGGTDVDWFIEHNSGFLILELKTFNRDVILIPKAQMHAYEKLYDALSKRHILFIGHDDIDFKNLTDSVWFFEMKDWKSGWIPHTEGNLTDLTYSDKEIHGYIVERSNMEKINVKILRDKIDLIWSEFEAR